MISDADIHTALTRALNSLIARDGWLLQQDLSEQSISHRLACYLDNSFEDYEVDCEYNGDVNRENDKKAISILKDRLQQFRLLRQHEMDDIESQLTTRTVFPDIIIHKRGTNEYNLCIVEIKKTSSRVPFDYDAIKLSAYTGSDFGNSLKYQLGAFVSIKTGDANLSYEIKYFKDGHEIDSIAKNS